MRSLISYGLILVLAPYALFQVRKPDRWLGRFFLWLMNASHSGVTDWGLKHAVIGKGFKILDVGCGGGRTMQKLAALAPEGMVYGVDYADGSVAASQARNAGLIAQGTVSQLPFANDVFDLVTAIETQYYWPDLVKDMQEILRVLAPGGTLVIIAESYKSGKFDAIQRPAMKVLKSSHLSVEDQRELFTTAGYQDVRVFEERAKGWICAMGTKA
jgi:SAM-dependent methyltransferase